MFNKGDMVEVNARTGGNLPNGDPARAWKRGKVVGTRRNQAGSRQYQIDAMTPGKAPLWFDDKYVRAIPGVTPTRPIPTYRPNTSAKPAKAISDFPHKCPNCKGPAYIPPTPGGRVDCQAKCSVDPYIKPDKPKKARMY